MFAKSETTPRDRNASQFRNFYMSCDTLINKIGKPILIVSICMENVHQNTKGKTHLSQIASFYPYQLDQSISMLGVVGWCFLFLFKS